MALLIVASGLDEQAAQIGKVGLDFFFSQARQSEIRGHSGEETLIATHTHHDALAGICSWAGDESGSQALRLGENGGGGGSKLEVALRCRSEDRRSVGVESSCCRE